MAINLTTACQVNGSADTSGADFGTVDFGSHSSLFSSAEAQAESSSGSVQVQCTPGTAATLTIDGGQHDTSVAGHGRAMANGAVMVPYDIYSDADHGTVLANGSAIAIPSSPTGDAQTVNIYGLASGTTGLIAGDYTDTIDVTLTF